MKSLLAETEISKVTVCGVKVGKSKLFWKHWTKSDHKHLTQSHFFSLRTRTLLTRFGTPFWEKVELLSWQTVEILLREVAILLRVVDISLQTVEIFMMNDQDFQVERSRFSWWTIEIFMLNGRDFSCWTVEIFMMNGRDFHDEQSRFSWETVKVFMMKGRDFHDERSRIVYCLG